MPLDSPIIIRGDRVLINDWGSSVPKGGECEFAGSTILVIILIF